MSGHSARRFVMFSHFTNHYTVRFGRHQTQMPTVNPSSNIIIGLEWWCRFKSKVDSDENGFGPQ